MGAMGKGISTALGDAVNIAFGIEALTRVVDRPVLVSAAFLDGWDQGRHHFESCGYHKVKGRGELIEVFALRRPARPCIRSRRIKARMSLRRRRSSALGLIV